MEITIKFFKSSSKYYEPTCKNAEYFDSYVQDKSENKVVLNEDDIWNKTEHIRKILDTVSNWSKTEYYIDKDKVNFGEINQLLQIVTCKGNCSNCALGIDEHCYEGTGWGCNFLTSISLRQESYYPYKYTGTPWYDFGKFEDEEWIIDKNRIMECLMKEIQGKRLNFCPYFKEKRIKKVVDSLLDKIIVTEEGEWEYKYREAPIGMAQSEIIGVQPKGSGHIYGTSTSLSINMSHGSDEDKNGTQMDNKNVPTVTFDDIGGLDEIVQQVREVIELPIIAPNLIEHYSITPHKGILLYGPPGCGKTLIAKAIAHEIKAHFISVNGPEILNRYVGQSESNLRDIFEEAKAMEPSIIYFDEFDSIATTRDAEDNPLMATVVNQLLTLLDGMNTLNKVCCIASTNRIDMIDEAIRRPGRFDYVIEIKRPSVSGCKSIFRIHTKDMPIEEGFNKDLFVEKYLNNCTGADIAFVVNEAAYNSIRRTVDLSQLFLNGEGYDITDQNVITERDFIKAAKTLKESRTRADTAQYRNLWGS